MSHSVTYFPTLIIEKKRKEKEIEKEINMDLAVVASQWFKVANSNKERMAVCSIRREAQQQIKCWECGEAGHCLWTCPKKAAHPQKGEAQQRGVQRLVCRECKEENHVVRNCDSYWRWRE